jgi:hypothetical protein
MAVGSFTAGPICSVIISALSLENLPDFLRLLDEYHIGAALLTPSTPAVALLDRLPDWKRIYSDDVAVVHARR